MSSARFQVLRRVLVLCAMTVMALVSGLLWLSSATGLPAGLTRVRAIVESVDRSLKPGTAISLCVAAIAISLVVWVWVVARGPMAAKTVATASALALLTVSVSAYGLRDVVHRLGSPHGPQVYVPRGPSLTQRPPGMPAGTDSHGRHATAQALASVAHRASAPTAKASPAAAAAGSGATDPCLCDGGDTGAVNGPASDPTIEGTDTTDSSTSTSTDVTTGTSADVSTEPSPAVSVAAQTPTGSIGIPPNLSDTITQTVDNAMANADAAVAAATDAAAAAEANADAGSP